MYKKKDLENSEEGRRSQPRDLGFGPPEIGDSRSCCSPELERRRVAGPATGDGEEGDGAHMAVIYKRCLTKDEH